MAAFCRFYGMSPSEFWGLRFDEYAAMRDLLVETWEVTRG